ncbi:MAG: BspA family leucine-rich repeat surface protein [Bacteroidales bacterium]|nr:BspA family leucine-rich repeat surface protein [Bacteroidales bacterium]MDD4669755.1 BspA family leucine-rich repeat surface protein [Bacteroidales bacterium]
MKKIYNLLAVALLLTAGCAKEMPDNIKTDPEEAGRIVTVKMTPSALTKTTLNSTESKLEWETGDRVAYFIDDTGTRQVATIENGTFPVTVDENGHTIYIVYPVSDNSAYDNVTYAEYPKNNIPTNQLQRTLNGNASDFNGKNLPITGRAAIEAGTTNAEVNATYDIEAASILTFTIDGATGKTTAVRSLTIYTTDAGKMLTDGKDYVNITFPEGTKVEDLQGKTVYAVVKAANYNEIKVSMMSGTTTYVLSTDITTKLVSPGFGNKQIYKYKWNLQSTTTSAISGLMVKLGDRPWSDWYDTESGIESLENMESPLGTDEEPYSIKIATGGDIVFLIADGDDLSGQLYRFEGSSSRFAIDMSAAGFAPGAAKSLFQDVTTLKSFVFPIGENAQSITDISGMFSGCTNLASVSAIPSNVTYMTRTFSGCSSFNQAVTIPAGVTDMSRTFEGCSSLNSPITIPINSEIRTMVSAFDGCSEFNEPIHIPAGDTTLENTFCNCTAFNQAVTIPAGVTNMSFTFSGCRSLISPITIPTNSEIRTMQGAFKNCTAFNQAVTIPANVTDLSGTFYYCSSLNSLITIPANSEILTMLCTFSGCSAFNKPVHIPAKNTDMYSTFYRCTAFNQDVTIPASVSDISQTFEGCSALSSEITINIAGNRTPAITSGESNVNIKNMFIGCTTSNITLWVPFSKLGTEAVNKKWYENLNNGSWTFKELKAIPTNAPGGTENINQINGNW